MHMQSEVAEALREQGYTEALSVGNDGRVIGDGIDWSPADVVVDQVRRFDGLGNPADQSTLVALAGPDDKCGLLELPHDPRYPAHRQKRLAGSPSKHRCRTRRAHRARGPLTSTAGSPIRSSIGQQP